jgi:hypothetical protein
MANDAYKVLQDTSLPKAVARLEDDVNGNEQYQTEGRAYAAGGYVLAEDITPPLLAAIEDGQFEGILEPVSRDEAVEALTYTEVGMFAPEHAVEHQALVAAGHRVLDREGVLEARSLGSDDAAAAIEAQKEEIGDERPNLSFENTPDLANDEDDQYVSVDDAVEAGLQVTPSGVVANNPFADKAKKKASGRKASKPKAADSESSGDDDK